jgi:hypothetical protein
MMHVGVEVTKVDTISRLHERTRGSTLLSLVIKMLGSPCATRDNFYLGLPPPPMWVTTLL